MSARSDLPGLAQAIEAGNERRLAVRAALAPRRASLPLRYWRQQAHLTTPAADPAMARKAVEGGTAPVARILDRLALSPADLADALDVPIQRVEERLARPVRAPLVMLDGEDAIAPGDDMAARGLDVAASVFSEADWSGDGPRSLRFFRPPGFNLETTVRDLYTLLWRLAERSYPGSIPLDGIIFPKIEHPEEAVLVNDLLDEAEAALSLRGGAIRVGYLVESGFAAGQLAEIVEAAAPRLASLIFGVADFSADLGLPGIGNDHPLADWARAEIVALAGAAGVPAIDAMTLDYPVADPALDAGANRTRWLRRMRLAYDDAVRARDLGMLGKWVGHPAQLFAVLLAYDEAFAPAAIEAEAAKLEAYRQALSEEVGATMIGGLMSDRATDRHARVLLRQAAALGRFDPGRAVALGVIDEAEAAEVVGA